MKKGLGCAGFNLVQNNGEAAGQTVMHFHMHVIPRYEGGPGNRQLDTRFSNGRRIDGSSREDQRLSVVIYDQTDG